MVAAKIEFVEEKRPVPYLSSIERLAKQEGRKEGLEERAREVRLWCIQLHLRQKFGSAGTRTMAKVKLIDNLPRLRSLSDALWDENSVQAFRDLLE